MAQLDTYAKRELAKVIFGEHAYKLRHNLVKAFLAHGEITVEEFSHSYRLKNEGGGYHTDVEPTTKSVIAQFMAIYNPYTNPISAVLTPVVVQTNPATGTAGIFHSHIYTGSFSEKTLEEAKYARWIRGTVRLNEGARKRYTTPNMPAYSDTAPTVRANEPLVTLNPNEICVTSVIMPYRALTTLGKAWTYNADEQTAAYSPAASKRPSALGVGGEVKRGEHEDHFREVIAHLVSADTSIEDLNNIKFKWRSNRGQGRAHVPAPPAGWATQALAWMTQSRDGGIVWHRTRPADENQIDCVAYHASGPQWWRTIASLGSGKQHLRRAFVDAAD